MSMHENKVHITDVEVVYLIAIVCKRTPDNFVNLVAGGLSSVAPP